MKKIIENYPLISIAIPTFNEERYIVSCLESIFSQDYPSTKLQVIIIDNFSTDKTLQLAKKYPVEILMDKTKDAQYLKMLGFRKSRGDYFIFMDADSRLANKRWFKTMLEPHLADKELAGSFTDIIPDKKDSPASQYIASFSVYTSPLFQFFSQRIEDTVVEKKGDFYICEYTDKIAPPTGSSLYKMKYLKVAKIAEQEKFMELDVLAIMVSKGFRKYAYNPKMGIYHSHIEHVSEIFSKRIRNINRNYMKDLGGRHFLWIDFSDKKSIIKILLWIIYAYTFALPILRGLFKALKNKKLFYFYYEPIVTVLETSAVIYSILIHPRKMQFFRKLFALK